MMNKSFFTLILIMAVLVVLVKDNRIMATVIEAEVPWTDNKELVKYHESIEYSHENCFVKQSSECEEYWLELEESEYEEFHEGLDEYEDENESPEFWREYWNGGPIFVW